MTESSKSNDTLGKQWPEVDLIFTYEPKYVIYIVAVVVAIMAVLITIVNSKAAICAKISQVIPSNIFYVLFGSLCALIEFNLSSQKVINPAEVIIITY